MRLAVIGGGEFGTYHARQLVGARVGEVVVVDRDRGCRAFAELGGAVTPVVAEWDRFLESEVGSSLVAGDHVVPAPFAPHVLWDWLASGSGLRRVAPLTGWRLPYEVVAPDGALFVSASGWLCPATCVEPAHCPVLHAPRDWDLGVLLEVGARERGWEPVLFRCLHFARGIGTVPVASLLEARARVRALGRGSRVLVATSSRCHAAVGGLEVAAAAHG
ncbi:MAG TPA: hypothetical protein VF134_00360 [Candidatus Dormibacteraeota bacterium]